MPIKNLTVDAVISQLPHRPGLAAALGEVRYALRHVSGGQTGHAAYIEARAALDGAIPADIAIPASDLLAAYLAEADRQARAERYTTVTWPCGDRIVVEGGGRGDHARIVEEVQGTEGPITEAQRAEARSRRYAYVASVR